MKCTTAKAYIQEGLDGRLTAPDEAAVEAHLLSCQACRRYCEGTRQSVEALSGLPDEGAPLDFGATVSFQLRRSAGGRRWGFPVAFGAAIAAGLVLLMPSLQGGFPAAEHPQTLQAQL
ncbi:MAG: zf-HC2 domain-containing protein, partial [Cyanobacteria bacterium REEB65]|nr:zf-HC2 domain-containing protein [Cyanobacteria bacterium REEB65]